MALLFCDSFDHYDTPEWTTKWSGGTFGVIVPGGRTGNCLSCSAVGPWKAFPADYATLVAGLAHNPGGFANAVVYFDNAVSMLRTYLNHVGDGRLRFGYHAGYTDVAGDVISTFMLSLNVWYYVELKATVSVSGRNVTFTAEARVNEIVILNETKTITATGIDPAILAAHPGFNQAHLQAAGASYGALVDDVYVTDGDYLGDIKIGVLYPNADGDAGDWTPSSGADHYAMVKEHPPDEDTTYNSATIAGQTDLYQLDDIPPDFSGDIRGAQALWRLKKSDAGSATVRSQIKSAGVVLEGSDVPPSYTAYNYIIQPYGVSPFTGAHWSAAEINALQLGIKRT
ncbi:MAG TPA: hypothetical protein VFA33_07575 [Bryobacteraceae bacterium]|nr:hypothetical protein [Bryobacteraceae bacterium]